MGNLYSRNANTGSQLTRVNSTSTVEIGNDSEWPASVTDNTTYIIRGTINAGNTLTIDQPGVSFVGNDKNIDVIVSNNAGPLFTVEDQSFNLQELGLRNTGGTGATQGSILTASNLTPGSSANFFGRDKVLTMRNCEIKYAFDIMDVSGFELVDMSNNLIWFSTGSIGCKFASVRHLEFQSNELFNWFTEVGGTYSTAKMLELAPNLGTTGPAGTAGISNAVVNIVGCIIHPEDKQDGMVIDDGSSTVFGTISANTFIDVGQLTGTIETSTDALLDSLTTDPGGNAAGTYTDVLTTTSGLGTNLRLDVEIGVGGTVSSVTVNNTTSTGENYAIGDTVTVKGSVLGGSSPTTDIIFTLVQDDIRGILFGVDYDVNPNFIVSGNQGAVPFGDDGVQIITKASDFPAPNNNVITLADDVSYQVVGSVNMGSNRIVVGTNNTLFGVSPSKDVLTYTGATGSTFITAVDNDVKLYDLGITVTKGVLLDATNIDYTINPGGTGATDPFMGRNKRLQIINCDLRGGGNAALTATGGEVGAIEGYGTVNFNSNIIRFFDDGLKISNMLSFEGISNKIVLFNQQGGSMIDLRADNWSGQSGGTGSYIPPGMNGFIFSASILHPKNTETGFLITKDCTINEGSVSGNVLFGGPEEGSAVFAGGLYEFFPGIIVEGNQGLANNTPEFQVNLLTSATDESTTTGNTAGNLTVLEANGEFILRSFSRFYSIRGICTAGSSGPLGDFIPNELIYAGSTTTAGNAGATAVGYFQSAGPTAAGGP